MADKKTKLNTKKNIYTIYSVKSYIKADNNFIKNENINFSNIKKIIQELNNDNYYHFRINKNVNYIFFGDLDKYNKNITDFIIILKNFLLKYYNLSFEDHEFKYTKNNKIDGSYHYMIPKWNLSVQKLKEILTQLLKTHKKDFCRIENNKSIKSIDTTIYSEHWFRCHNQSKGLENIEQNQHIIINGDPSDFIISHIPKESINIENIECLIDKSIKKTKQNKEVNILDSDEQKIIIHNDLKSNSDIIEFKEHVLSTTISQTNLYKKMFDECYKKERFEGYDYWISIGMAIKNTFLNDEEAFDLFNYYSAKGTNYEGYEKTKCKYSAFIKKKNSNGYTVATIHYYAIEDNKPKFIEIMNKNSFELGQTDICKYLKIIAGYKFIYKIYKDDYKLYCYNGKYWQTDDIILRKCISSELYNFLKTILIEVYWNTKDFNILKNKIEKLKTISYKKEIIETYKEYATNNEINFDTKWWLLGFNNIVYDMEEEKFREYKYDDYISMTCGYDWREPTIDEVKTINDLIELIMPIKEERDAYLQILCTAIDGRCLEKFIIFNGSGGNGKGLIDDLMLVALGSYGLIGNNGILFEISKTGSNPEKANIHKKRFVVFREPSEKNKFQNSIIKELTGGGNFSARTLYEKDGEKELNLTMIVECNKKPLFIEEPQDSEIRRIIDIYFRSTFVTDTKLLNAQKNIYLANPIYKTKEFQNKHKYALIKILLKEHHKFYKENKSILIMPQSIIDRTKTYLELSCNIVQWFKDTYKESENPNNICKIKDIYIKFCDSMYYYNLSKADKTKYNKAFFCNYIQNNIFFRNYYCDRYNNIRNIIKGFEEIINNDDEE